MEIDILIDREFKGKIDAGRLQEIACKTLIEESVSPGAEVGLVITGQERIRELNKAYLGKDRPTDVISFAMLREEAPGTGTQPFVMPPDGLVHLGEVVISYPQAEIQAEERHHSTEKELDILVIHGVLHLLGYDDEKPEPKKKMQAREAELLAMAERDLGRGSG